MANTAVKISALPSIGTASGNSLCIVVNGANSNTSRITVANLLGNTVSTVPQKANRLHSGLAPANSSSNGTSGDISYDSNYVYICTGTNTWKRAAIATW